MACIQLDDPSACATSNLQLNQLECQFMFRLSAKSRPNVLGGSNWFGKTLVDPEAVTARAGSDRLDILKNIFFAHKNSLFAHIRVSTLFFSMKMTESEKLV